MKRPFAGIADRIVSRMIDTTQIGRRRIDAKAKYLKQAAGNLSTTPTDM